MTDKDKVYKAVLLLGQETDTQDISGQVLNQAKVNVTEQAVYDAISQFIGRQKQVPPMYSAIKVNGKKLYELAREGKVIERKARDIEVFDIKVESIDLPEVTMTVHCSKGTYIRTLCNDIGERLDEPWPEHRTMGTWLRVRVAGFDLEHAPTLRRFSRRWMKAALIWCGLLMECLKICRQCILWQRLISLSEMEISFRQCLRII